MNTRNVLPTVWRLEAQDQGTGNQCLLTACFLVHSHLLAVFSHSERSKLSGASFIRALIPFTRAPPSRPNHPKVTLSNNSHKINDPNRPVLQHKLFIGLSSNMVIMQKYSQLSSWLVFIFLSGLCSKVI